MAELAIRIEPEDIVNRVLDEFEYKGKTIREWADCLSNPKTNAARIRTMSDEELAEFMAVTAKGAFSDYGRMTSRMCWLDWLKSPADVKKIILDKYTIYPPLNKNRTNGKGNRGCAPRFRAHRSALHGKEQTKDGNRRTACVCGLLLPGHADGR